MPSTRDVGIVLCVGSDRARKLQRIQQLERLHAVHTFDRHHLDGAALSAAELLAFCRQQPAHSALRLIVVDEAHRLDRSAIEALLTQMPRIVPQPCVVLLVEADVSARHPVHQLLAAASDAAAGIQVEEFPGRDAPAARPFALTDALGRGELGEALRAVHEQLMAAREPQEILGLLAWQLNRWIAVRRLLEAGYSTAGMAAALKLKEWQVQRLCAEVARRPLRALQDLLTRCWRLDVEIKTGRIAAVLGLEQFVAELCAATEQLAGG